MSAIAEFIPVAPYESAKRELFDAMLAGFAAHRDTANISTHCIDADVSFLRRLRDELGWPWDWETARYEQWQSARRAAGIQLNTRRDNQRTILVFTEYICNSVYRWIDRCVELVGHRPYCVVNEANRILHVEANESGKRVRPATRREIQTLFDYIDYAIDSPRHHPITTYRDGIAIKVSYALSHRRVELAGQLGGDFRGNARYPEYGHFASATIRNGKAKARGPQRLRVVHTSRMMKWIVPELEQYIRDVRPLFRGAATDPHLFLANHGGALSVNYLSKMFRDWANEAGLDRVLSLHSLRRSFATHHVEAGYEGAAISVQMGHEWESSTAEYVQLQPDWTLHELARANEALGGR